MDKFIKLLDENLEYVSHEIIDNTIYINIASNCNECESYYCENYLNKVHSKHKTLSHYLPVRNKKVELILTNKKYFYINT